MSVSCISSPDDNTLLVFVIELNRYSVRLLGSAEYQLLGNTRYSVVTSLPKPSIEKKVLNNNSFTRAHIYESKLTYIEAQGPIYLYTSVADVVMMTII